MAFDIAPYGQAIAETSAFLNGILKRVFPEKMSELDAAKMQQELTMALMRGEHEPLMAQLRINAEEARHASMFVAGWRPFIGWTCGAAFAWQFVVQPFFTWGVLVAGQQLPPTPVLDIGPLLTVLGGMLGLGALRTFEKVKDVARERVK